MQQIKIFSSAVCLCSAVDASGSMFITISNMFLKIYTAIFPLFPLKFRSNFSPKKYFFLPLYLSFFAEFSAIWQQCPSLDISIHRS
jgi:hypothetical protein